MRERLLKQWCFNSWVSRIFGCGEEWVKVKFGFVEMQKDRDREKKLVSMAGVGCVMWN